MKLISYFILALCAVFPISIFAQVATSNPLASHPYWLKLGHYRQAVLSEWKSEVDSKEFFFAKDGKLNPLTELYATIKAFDTVTSNTNEKDNPICQFPARYNWLKDKVKNQWHKSQCNEIDKWKETLNPKGLTLVFPTAFMNSPSSMFGHTLLRIDAIDQTRNRELIAFAVNFAAQPDNNDNAAAYAIKGLLGKYPGNFTVMPYYRKVREYNDIESRDIWEYQLNFSEEEVEKVLMHLWEMQRATFDYYFTDENCSYQLLGLLQLANDDLNLTSQFKYQAIPSDTVSALQKNNLLKIPKYRPSLGTKLFHYASQLTKKQITEAIQVMETGSFNSSNYTKSEQAAIYEMAYEWLNFNFNDQRLNRKTIAPRLKEILNRRSKLVIASPFTSPERPSASPEQGHSSSRLGVVINNSKSYQNSAGLSYRLAYHDFLDKSSGYIPGARISFLDIEANIQNGGAVSLERLYLIDAMSIAPDNQIFNSWSWGMRIGYDRQPNQLTQSGRTFLQAGYGKSYGNPNTLQSYILGSIAFNAGDITQKLTPALGTEVGAIWQINGDNKISVNSNIMWLVDAQVNHSSEVGINWSWSYSKNFAIRSKLSYKNWLAEDIQSKVTAHYYF